MNARIHSHHWCCEIPDCRGCGAGYGSQSQADRALVRHIAQAHRALAALIGGGQ